MELVNTKKYVMYLSAYKDDKLMNFYKGTFRGVHSLQDTLIFNDVIEMKSEPTTFRGHSGYYVSMKRNDLMFFRKDVYTFHDIEQVKENGKRAIQRMEKRSLDIILKRLVNEHFEW